jgi:hypothetical protein
MDTKRTTQRMKLKTWFFEKINKIDHPIAKLTRRKRGPKLIKLDMRNNKYQ